MSRTENISSPLTANMSDEEKKERRAKWLEDIEAKRKAKGIEGEMSPNFLLFQELSEGSDKWLRKSEKWEHDCLMMISATSLGKLNNEHHQILGVHLLGKSDDLMRMFQGFFQSHPEHIDWMIEAIASSPKGREVLSNMAMVKISADQLFEQLGRVGAPNDRKRDTEKKDDAGPILSIKPDFMRLPESQIPPDWNQAWIIHSKLMESHLKELEEKGETPMLSKNFEAISHAQYILRKFEVKEQTNEEHDAMLFIGEFGLTNDEYRSSSMMQGNIKSIIRLLVGFLEENPQFLSIFEFAVEKTREELGPLGSMIGAMRMHNYLTQE